METIDTYEWAKDMLAQIMKELFEHKALFFTKKLRMPNMVIYMEYEAYRRLEYGIRAYQVAEYVREKELNKIDGVPVYPVPNRTHPAFKVYCE